MRKLKSFFLVATVALTSAVVGVVVGRFLFKDISSQTPVQVEPRDAADSRLIFVLAGQSNMEGRAPLVGNGDCLARGFAFGKDFNWYGACQPISDAGSRRSRFARQVDRRSIGPGFAFAEGLLGVLLDTAANGLIPAARGGTSIASWQRSTRDGALYAEMLQRALASTTQGQIAGVIFFQGEKDAKGEADDHPNERASYFSKFVSDFRTDVGHPRLPVVFAQLGADAGRGLWSAVK